MNKKWKSFQKLTEKCYENMIGAEEDDSCWQNGFELLKALVLEEKKQILSLHRNWSSWMMRPIIGLT